MALEASAYDIIYGKLLSLNFEPTYAKEFAKTLYQISNELQISVNEILKYVTEDGLRFENEIYDRLNLLRTNSSQLGFLDQNYTTSSILDQIIQNYDVTPTPSPTPAPTPSPTPSPTPAPTPSPTPAPTPAPTPSPTPAPTPSPTPAPTPSPTPAPTPAPTPSPTPAPTPSPAPTATYNTSSQVFGLEHYARIHKLGGQYADGNTFNDAIWNNLITVGSRVIVKWNNQPAEIDMGTVAQVDKGGFSFSNHYVFVTNPSNFTMPVLNGSPLVDYRASYFRIESSTPAPTPSPTPAPTPSPTPAPIPEEEFTEPGTYTWIAPEGVTSVSAVCVGGGGGGITMSSGGTASGGGGGGLGWKNNIPVTPGQGYTVVVGSYGWGYGLDGGQGPDGQDSYFISPTVVKGGGGKSGNWNIVGQGGTYVGDGGGNGGNPGTGGGGGGGAGGYLGNGGNGGTGTNPATGADSGSGGGGGGAGSYPNNQGNSGGGVGLYGRGADGGPGVMDTFSNQGYGGGGGSGGQGNRPTTSGGSTLTGGGQYGGGGPGQVNFFQNGQIASYGGKGGVRIIWGVDMSYPDNAI